MFNKLKYFFLDVIEVLVFAIAIFLFIYLLVLQPHKIKGASMEPSFPNGQYLLTDKVTYRFREPDRGDVVVFEAPASAEEEFIKRIIALPGETISLNNGAILINDLKLDESYIAANLATSGSSFLQEGVRVEIPSEHYLVLGDNRPFSSDSRAWGFVSKDKITGRAWLIYWPLSDIGVVDDVSYNFESGNQ